MIYNVSYLSLTPEALGLLNENRQRFYFSFTILVSKYLGFASPCTSQSCAKLWNVSQPISSTRDQVVKGSVRIYSMTISLKVYRILVNGVGVYLFITLSTGLSLSWELLLILKFLVAIQLYIILLFFYCYIAWWANNSEAKQILMIKIINDTNSPSLRLILSRYIR